MDTKIGETACLAAESFTSDVILARERDYIFNSGWVSIGFNQKLSAPGDVSPATVAGQPLLVTRDLAGNLHVFHNICRHRGLQLIDSSCSRSNGLVTCPYHSWSYRLDGSLQATPYWDKKPGSAPAEEITAKLALLPVRFAVWCDIIFVNIDGKAKPFNEFIAPLEDRWRDYDFSLIRLSCSKHYQPKANWKLVCENFLDGYHVPFVHRQVGGPQTAVNFEVMKLSKDIFGFYLPTGEADKPKSEMPLPVFPGLAGENKTAQHLFCIYPNTLVIIAPGWFQVITVQAVAAGLSRETLAIYLAGDESQDEKLSDTRNSFLEKLVHVNDQDMAILEKLQNGHMTSAADHGRFVPAWDETQVIFENRINESLGNC